MLRIVENGQKWGVKHFNNKQRASPLSQLYPPELPIQLSDYESARKHLASWEDFRASPLRSVPQLAENLGVKSLMVKDETERLGVGSFKALGGGLVVSELKESIGSGTLTIATASAGNHGIGVAWGCQRAGCQAVVYLHQGVSESAADKIRSFGAEVRRVKGGYEDSVLACQTESDANGWQVVQDVDSPGYVDVPRRIFEGYSVLAGEIVDQLAEQKQQLPTHVLVNAGVGGLAAGVCAHLWARYGEARPRFITCEPIAADCLLQSARAESMVTVSSEPTTVQVGLDCRTPAPLAWSILSKGVNDFVAVPDAAIYPTMALLEMATTEGEGKILEAGESAVAGLATVVAAASQPELREALGIDEQSRVLTIVCEAPPDRERFMDVIKDF